MESLRKMEGLARTRTYDLVKQKEAGAKLVGYVPEGFFPEELVYAAGAIPVPLIKGGAYEAVWESLKYVPRFLDTWCRSQIAYKMNGDPYYNLFDLLFVPTTDCNEKAIGDMFSYWTDVKTVYFGVPHNKLPTAIEYYRGGLDIVKSTLEEYTGTAITDTNLKAEAAKQNTIRQLFRGIRDLRKQDNPPISGYDYVRLHHWSMMLDRDAAIECLTEILAELKAATPAPSNKVRLYLTGSTLAMGDYRVYELIDQVGGDFVCEDFAGGLRPVLDDVNVTGGDILDEITDAYFTRRREGAWFRPSAHRVDYLIDDIKQFNCQGVVWYQILYRESYDMQSYYFEDIIKEATGAPMVKVETDYDASEKGNIKTRLETLCDIVQGG